MEGTIAHNSIVFQENLTLFEKEAAAIVAYGKIFVFAGKAVPCFRVAEDAVSSIARDARCIFGDSERFGGGSFSHNGITLDFSYEQLCSF